MHKPALRLSIAVLALMGLASFAGSAPARADAPGAAAPAFPWAPSYDQAVARARAARKDLVLLFTGSDWCGFCIQLENEVFHAPEFARRATQHFEFVYLDFPQAPDLQARVRDKATRDRLQKDYGVGGFPTMWLATADGMPYATVSYPGGGPEAFLAILLDQRSHRDRLLPLLRAGRNADAATLRTALPFLVEDGLIGLAHYGWVLDRARQVDPEGRLGLRQHADRIGELNRMMALFENGAPWDQIYRFLLSARFIMNEHKYASGLALCAEHYLLPEGRYDEALDCVQRAQRTPSLADNQFAQGDFRSLRDRILAARAAAGSTSR
ncbi:MAG: thioredoxin family protein [Planctomycetota bacterium]